MRWAVDRGVGLVRNTAAIPGTTVAPVFGGSRLIASVGVARRGDRHLLRLHRLGVGRWRGCASGAGGCASGAGGCALGAGGCALGAGGCASGAGGCALGAGGCASGAGGCALGAGFTRARGGDGAGRLGGAMEPGAASRRGWRRGEGGSRRGGWRRGKWASRRGGRPGGAMARRARARRPGGRHHRGRPLQPLPPRQATSVRTPSRPRPSEQPSQIAGGQGVWRDGLAVQTGLPERAQRPTLPRSANSRSRPITAAPRHIRGDPGAGSVRAERPCTGHRCRVLSLVVALRGEYVLSGRRAYAPLGKC